MNHLDQTPDAGTADPASPRRHRTAALAVGAALVIGGVALAVWAVTSQGAPAPQAVATSTTPASGAATPATGDGSSATAPVASAVPSDPADSPGAPAITAFSVEPTSAACPDDRASTVPLTFSWTSAGADRGWIGIGTTDASVQPFAEVDPEGDGYTGIAFACGDGDQVFTLTVEGPGGAASSSITVIRELD